MFESHIAGKAKQDFDKARSKQFLAKFINILTPNKYNLLSFSEVREIIRPKKETYKGLTVVPISHIVGSEGRYKDFTKAFLPKYEFLRSRWENINKAHSKDVVLPPIKLYEIGGVYFVRDGNHRVSVAKSQGQKEIDAEVTSISSEIQINPKMTSQELKKAVIAYEKDEFFKQTKLEKIIDPEKLNFSATGRYQEILNHIHGHKYYMNLNKEEEISFEEAAESWYNNLFLPIMDEIKENKLLTLFKKRTMADFYVWIIRLWDNLKKEYGNDIPIQDAIKNFSKTYMKQQFSNIKSKIFSRNERRN